MSFLRQNYYWFVKLCVMRGCVYVCVCLCMCAHTCVCVGVCVCMCVGGKVTVYMQ